MTLLAGIPSETGPLPALTRRLRLAIVGGGKIGERHREAAWLSGRFELVAATPSQDRGRATTCGTRWELDPARVHVDYRDMLASEAGRDDGAEVVCIATPNDSHHAIACAAIDAGLDVVCEKPMTLTVEEASDLQARVAARGAIFALAHPYLEYPMVHEARHLVRAGAIGAVTQVHVEFLLDSFSREIVDAPRHVQWRQDPVRAGAGALADIGTHAHQLVRFVSGLAMTHVSAHATVCGGPKRVEDSAFLLFRLEGAIPGTMVVSQAFTGLNQGLRLRIVGSEGSLEWSHAAAHTLVRRRVDGPEAVYQRVRGRGLSPAAERLLLMQPGIDQGVLEGWVNLFAQVAVACAVRRDAVPSPGRLVHLVDAAGGAAGVRFVHAALRSAAKAGEWTAC